MISVVVDPESVRTVLEGVRKAARERGGSPHKKEEASGTKGRSPPTEQRRIPMPPSQGRLEFEE